METSGDGVTKLRPLGVPLRSPPPPFPAHGLVPDRTDGHDSAYREGPEGRDQTSSTMPTSATGPAVRVLRLRTRWSGCLGSVRSRRPTRTTASNTKSYDCGPGDANNCGPGDANSFHLDSSLGRAPRPRAGPRARVPILGLVTPTRPCDRCTVTTRCRSIRGWANRSSRARERELWHRPVEAARQGQQHESYACCADIADDRSKGANPAAPSDTQSGPYDHQRQREVAHVASRPCSTGSWNHRDHASLVSGAASASARWAVQNDTEASASVGPSDAAEDPFGVAPNTNSPMTYGPRTLWSRGEGSLRRREPPRTL